MSFSGGTFMVQEYYSGAYHDIATYTSLPASCTNYNHTLNAGTSKVKFIYVTKITGNICLDEVSITASTGGAPEIALSSTNPAVSAGNLTQASTNHIIYKFTNAVTTANTTINQVDFTTTGTYAAADVDNFKLLYHTADNFGAAWQIGSTITTTLGTGGHSFTGLTQSINSGATGYFWITTDIDAAATISNTLAVSAITTTDLTYASGNESGTAYGGGSQTIIAASSSSSDIIEASFDEPDNISYSAYQTSNITDGSPTTGAIKVGSFTLRDGGGASDGDSYSTILTDIEFSLSNSSKIRRVALYSGTTELSEVAASATPAFTGLTITAVDNGSTTFDIYISF